MLILLIIICVAVLLYSVKIEPNWIEINRYKMVHPALKKSVTIAHISDLHLNKISYREKKLRKLLREKVRPDIIVFTGDVFDYFGENHKIALSGELKLLIKFIASLPGEKYLVWGEGICNNRHLLGKRLVELGVHILEDESVVLDNFPDITLTGKLPELASFSLTEGIDGLSLTAGSTNLNSFIHYQAPNSSTLQDYDFTGTVSFSENSGGLGLTFYSQYSRYSDRFYRIRWAGASPIPELSPHGTGKIKGVWKYSKSLSSNTIYNFRIRAITEHSKTIIKARFWQKGNPEPDYWGIDAYDDSINRLHDGTIGVWTSGAGEKILFDNFLLVNSKDVEQIIMEEQFDDKAAYLRKWNTEKLFVKTIRPFVKREINILLTHSSEIVNDYKIEGFYLILAGDTHGGQVCWPWGYPIFKEKKIPAKHYSGLYNIGEMKVYTSKGIGTSRLPIRMFCRPEIAVFEFVK